MSTLASILLPAAALAAATWVVLRLGRRGEVTPARRSWSRPGLRMAALAAFVLLGLFVFPRLLGFAFLFLPFVWMRRSGRGPARRRDEPRW